MKSTTASVTIQRGVVGAGSYEQIYLWSTDLSGFYLSYTDNGLTYSLVEPLATLLLWRNRKTAVKRASFDPSLLIEKGITILQFEVAKKRDISDCKILEQHGYFADDERGNKGLFFPGESIGGEMKCRKIVVHRILRDRT